MKRLRSASGTWTTGTHSYGAPDGGRSSGGRAAAPLLRLLPGGSRVARIADRYPRAVDACYDFVARHRSALSRAVRALGAERPSGAGPDSR